MFLCLSICTIKVPVSWLNMIDEDTLRIPGTTDALNASMQPVRTSLMLNPSRFETCFHMHFCSWKQNLAFIKVVDALNWRIQGQTSASQQASTLPFWSVFKQDSENAYHINRPDNRAGRCVSFTTLFFKKFQWSRICLGIDILLSKRHCGFPLERNSNISLPPQASDGGNGHRQVKWPLMPPE